MTDEASPQTVLQQAPERRGPGRPPKAEATVPEARSAAPSRPNPELARRRAERAARGEVDHEFSMRLPKPSGVDQRAFQTRWVNDENGRVAAMLAREWERCTEDEMNGLEGSKHVGMSREGRPMNAVCLKKYRPWYDEDVARKRKINRDIEEQLRQGKAPGQALAQDSADRERFYVPDNNKVQRS